MPRFFSEEAFKSISDACKEIHAGDLCQFGTDEVIAFLKANYSLSGGDIAWLIDTLRSQGLLLLEAV